MNIVYFYELTEIMKSTDCWPTSIVRLTDPTTPWSPLFMVTVSRKPITSVLNHRFAFSGNSETHF